MGPGQTFKTIFAAGEYEFEAVFQILAGGRRLDGPAIPDRWFIDVPAVMWMLDRVESGESSLAEVRDALRKATEVELVWD